jgi:Transposase, Mutator family
VATVGSAAACTSCAKHAQSAGARRQDSPAQVCAAIGTVFVLNADRILTGRWLEFSRRAHRVRPRLGRQRPRAVAIGGRSAARQVSQARRADKRGRERRARVHAFERAYWAQLYGTIPLERLNVEIKRRTYVVDIFPNDASIARLVGAMMLKQNYEWSLRWPSGPWQQRP